MSKMTKKKKIILISALSFVAAILIVAAVIVGLLFRPANIPLREDLGFETVCYELPDDNDPTGHTGIENIGYMNWRLQHQNYWYSEAHVFVDNSTDDQYVSTYKQYHEGVLISTDISKSNLVNKAVQYCQVRGGNVVLFRNSKGGKSTFDAINTPWKTDKPDGHTIAEYKVKKGLPPLEFSVYILNENTVKEYSDVIDNGDGTYTQTFVLNYESEPMENDATYWYKTEMAYKANGMMKEDPQFSEVTVTYTFDDTWQVLSSQTREVYKTITGIGAISCVAESNTDYTYGDKELSYNPEFENYYKNYMEDYETPEDAVIDAAVCLSEAFADFVQGEVKLALDLTVDDSEYSGILQLNIPENDIRVDLGAIKLYMLAEDELYISYGDNVKAKIALSDLTSDQPATAAESEDTSGILDKLLEALGDEENFTLAADKRSATLSPSINLGELLGIDLDITLDLNFKFNISAEKEITLDYVKADGAILGADFAAELRFSDKGVEALTKTEAAKYTAIDINGITSLASAEALKFELAYSGNGTEIEGGVTINLNDLKVKADLRVVLDGNEDAAKNISLAYADDYAYITLGSEGSKPAMLKASASEAAEIIGELLGDIGAEAEEVDILQTVLDLLQKIGTGNVLNFLLADDGLSSMLALKGTDVATITIDGTALLNKLGVEFKLGEVTAELGNGKIGLSALGLNVTVTGTEAFTLSTDEYRDAADIMPVVKKLIDVISDKKLSVSGDIYLNINGTQVELDIELISVDWSDGLKIDIVAYVTAGEIAEPLRISYGEGVARASVGSLGIELKDGDLDEIIGAVLEILGQTTGEPVPDVRGGNISEIFASLGEKTDIFEIINSIEIGSSNGSIVTVSLGGFEISLFDETSGEGGILGIAAAYFADGVSLDITSAHITEYVEPEEPDYEIEYFGSDYILPVVRKLAEYIKENGLSVSGSLEIGGITLTLENLAIDWADGIEVGAHISLNYAQSEDKVLNKEIYFEYNSERAALYYDNMIAVVLDSKDYDSFMDAVKLLYDAISAEVDGGKASELPDGEELLAVLSEVEEEGGSDIFSILASLGFIKNEDGNLEISLGGLTVELLVKNDLIGANIAYGGDGENEISAGMTVGTYKPVVMPTGCDRIDAAELISIINDVTEIINNKGLTLSGAISLELGSTTAKLTLYGLSVGWANGIELQLDARLEVGDSVHDFYAQYNQSFGELKVVYGALDGGVGIDINIKDDAEDLEAALWAIYDRIAELVNSSVEGDTAIPQFGSLDELLDWISAGIGAVRDVAELAETVEESDGLSIVDILNSLDVSYKNGTLTVGVMGITVTLSDGDNGFHLALQTAGVCLEMEEVKIVNTDTTDFGLGEYVKVLNAEDIADLLDYVAATVELFVKDTFNITLEGVVTSTEEAYADVENNVKYKIKAGFEYQQGASGYPVHFVPETQTDEGVTPPDFWIAPDMYVHLNVEMEATLPEVDSVLFDIYIFDGNPTIDSNGKTTSAALTSGDNELDVYMSISRIASAQAGKNGTGAREPLKIYAPMNEIMTVLSAGLALVDVGSISIDALPELNGIITRIGGILDAMLVDRYFADTKDQFTSVGAGVIESILGSSISDFINDLINGLTGDDTDNSEEPSQDIALTVEDGEGYNRIRYGAIDRLGVTRDGDNTTLTLVVGETTATVTKSAYNYSVGEGEQRSGTRLTNLNVDKSALNDTDTLEDLNIDLAYSGINKVTAAELSGYTSFVGADSLVKALINSATHKVSSEDLISGDPDAENKSYVLNEVFFINGTITVNGKAIWFIPIANLTITVDAVSVTIDEEGEVSFNVRISYPKTTALGFMSLINADGTTDLSAKNGMIYIKRVSGGQTIYRAMPSSEFSNDILNHIGFMLNLGSIITDQFAGSSGGGAEAEEIKQDYGTQLSTYLKSFKYDEQNSRWTVVINGAGLLSEGVISLGDITVNFSAVKELNDDGEPSGKLIVDELGLSTSMNILGGVLSLSVDGTLYYGNPQNEWKNNAANSDVQGTHEDVVANEPGQDVRRVLNNMTDEEIIANIDWDRLSSESGGSYIELVFNGNGVMTSTMQYKEGVKIDFYVKEGIEDGAGEKYVTSDVQNALVNTATNSIYTVLKYPDMKEHEIDGYSFVWLDPVYDVSTDTYRVCARYVRSDLTVTYYSSVKFNGSVLSEWTAGYDGPVYESSVSILSLSYGRPDSMSASGYEFAGWGYYTADGLWMAATDLREIENLGERENIALHALWIRPVTATPEISRGGTIISYYSDVYLSFNVELFGMKELVEKVSLSGSYAVTANKTLSSDSGNGTFTAENTDGVFVLNKVGKRLTTSLTQHSSASINVTFNLQIDGKNTGRAFHLAAGQEF